MVAQKLRRGLPRVVGGEPWPPAGVVDAGEEAGFDSLALAQPVSSPSSLNAPQEELSVNAPHEESGEEEAGFDSLALAQPVSTPSSLNAPRGEALRRGLPRIPGGEPWPPAAPAPAVGDSSPRVVERGSEATETKRVERAERVETAPAPTTTAAASSPGASLRRGLPRTPGGEPWPPAGTAAVIATTAPVPEASPAAEPEARAELEPSAPAASVDVSIPLPFQRTVWQGTTPRHAAPAPEPKRYGPFTKLQWAGAVIVGGAGLLVAAAMAVFFVRWLLSTDPLIAFTQAFPGEYHLPEGAPVGFPGWLGWQHFFNVFLMVLIIRSGLTVRHDKRPTAFWTAKGNGKSKISLTLWFHQSLDILWLINGIVFVVLLVVTGQWMRVIPTSWEVFPNALSAVLQYISLDWPTENGWVNYNSVQQLAYFATIFLAAPLAAITGARMSGLWPKNAEKLNKAYPIEWARALHFPVMLYFVVFIAIHVFLVFATGALRNLNHMYAAQGSIDPNAYADNWTGFWMLVASLVVIVAAWVAARPMVLAPIAKLFGTVSAR